MKRFPPNFCLPFFVIDVSHPRSSMCSLIFLDVFPAYPVASIFDLSICWCYVLDLFDPSVARKVSRIVSMISCEVHRLSLSAVCDNKRIIIWTITRSWSLELKRTALNRTSPPRSSFPRIIIRLFYFPRKCRCRSKQIVNIDLRSIAVKVNLREKRFRYATGRLARSVCLECP